MPSEEPPYFLFLTPKGQETLIDFITNVNPYDNPINWPKITTRPLTIGDRMRMVCERLGDTWNVLRGKAEARYDD